MSNCYVDQTASGLSRHDGPPSKSRPMLHNINRISNYARHIAYCFQNTRGSYGTTAAMSLAYLGLHMNMFKSRSQTVTLQLRDFDVDLDMYSREVAGLWEIFQERQYLELPPAPADEQRVVVDVGANIGFFTMKQMLQFGDKLKLIAFEPDPTTYERLKKNVERMRQRTNADIRLVNRALDSHPGVAKFVRDVSVESHVVEGQSEAPGITVQLDTLDSVVEKEGLQRIDLLKIDVEGHELKVLAGARQKALPITDNITLEYHAPEFVEQITEFLRPFGFRRVNHNPEKAIMSFSKDKAQAPLH